MKNFIKYTYAFVNHDKNVWLFMANQLLHSALILRDVSFDASIKLQKAKGGYVEPGSELDMIVKDWSISRQASMLFGLSIENALKGLWIDKYKEEIDTTIEKLPTKIMKHNLINLAKDVDIKLNKAEKKVLNQLTASIVWEGRYPIPLNIQEYNKYFKSRPNFILGNSTKEKLPKDLESIFAKINERIDNTLPLHNKGS